MEYKVSVPKNKQKKFLKLLSDLGIDIKEETVPEVTEEKGEPKHKIEVVWVAGIVNNDDLESDYPDDAEVSLRSVAKLIKGGVDFDDLSDVLEIRSYLGESIDLKTEPIYPSLNAIIEAYTACGEDIEILEEVAELAKEIFGRMYVSVRKIRVSDLNRALSQATLEYRAEMSPEFDEYDSDEEVIGIDIR